MEIPKEMDIDVYTDVIIASHTQLNLKVIDLREFDAIIHLAKESLGKYYLMDF